MPIVWVASYPKSGNTWVRLFFRALNGGAAAGAILRTRPAFEASDADARWYAPLSPKPLADWTGAEIAAARPKAQAAIAASRSGPMLVKTHNRLGFDHGAPTINTGVTAAAIYVVRDLRDVAVSYAAYLGLGIDATIDHMLNPQAVTDRTNGVSWTLGAWGAHVDSWTAKAAEGVTVLRYEDLLARPTESFRAVLAALRDPSPRARVLAAIDAVRFDRLRREEARHGFAETPASAGRFFRSGRAGGWRKALDRAQAARLQDAFGPTMARFGYA